MVYRYFFIFILLVFNSGIYAQDEICELPGASVEVDNLDQFLRNISKNDCDKVVELIRAEDEIEGLDLSKFKKVKKTRRLDLGLFKLFSGKATDEMIDLYANCGKQRGSHKFVTNLILLEARNACMMPSPPGHLSWSEARKVAEEVGLRYQNMGLMNIKGKKDLIMKDAMAFFGTSVIHGQLKSLIPQQTIRKSVLNQITSITDLQNADPKTIKDYTSYKFTQDAPIEVAEAVFPHVLKEKISSKLPKSWSKTKQDNFIEQLSMKGGGRLEACLAPFKDRIGYGDSTEDAIAKRKGLEREFCFKNPAICNGNSCQKKINYFSKNAAPSDMQRIQSCVLKSMEEVVVDLTKSLIENELDGFVELKLSPEIQKQIVTNGQNELKSCMTGKSINYYTISPVAYGEAIEDCAAVVTTKVTRSVASQALEGMNLFSTTDSKQEIEKLMKKSLDPCLEKTKLIPGTSASACIPVIEISAAGRVLELKLLEMTNGDSFPEITKATEEYKVCVENIRQEAINSLPRDASPLLDSKLLTCSKNVISEASEAITKLTFKKTMDANINDLKNPNYAYSLEQQVADKVKKCISQGMDLVSDWKSFKTFNENNGFDKIKKNCSEEATALTVSKLTVHEASIELKKLSDNNVIKSEAIGLSIISNSAADIQGGTPLVPSTSSTEGLIEDAYLQRLKNNPMLTPKDFITEFKTVVTKRTLKQVQVNLLDQIEVYNQSQGNPPFKGIDQAMNPECLGEMNDRFKNDIKPKPGSDPKDTIKMVTELLSDGLNFARNKSATDYALALSDMSQMCQNLSQYSNVWAFLGDPRLEYLFKARIQKDLISNFTEVTEASYQKTLTDLEKSPYKALLMPFAEAQRNEMQKLIKLKFSDPNEFDRWLSKTTIITNLKEQLPKLIDGDKDLKKQLTNSIVGELFNSKEPNSFASEFTRIQLTANLGLQGYTQAKKKINDKMTTLSWSESKAKVKIQIESMKSLNSHWNPDELAKNFNWKGLSQASQQKLIIDIYHNAVLPQLQEKSPDMSAIEVSLTHILSTEKDAEGKNFSNRLEDTISKDINSKVGAKDVASGIIDDLF